MTLHGTKLRKLYQSVMPKEPRFQEGATNITSNWIFPHSTQLNYLHALGEASGVDGYTLGTIICLVDANQPIGQFKHVVSETANKVTYLSSYEPPNMVRVNFTSPPYHLLLFRTILDLFLEGYSSPYAPWYGKLVYTSEWICKMILIKGFCSLNTSNGAKQRPKQHLGEVS